MKIISASAGESILPTEEWLNDSRISLLHPLFEDRCIYLWLCSTHEVKCGQTQMWASRPKGKQNFISVDGFPFWWSLLWDQLHWDKRQGLPLTALTPAALYLDGWAKMNTSLAKAPFHQITLDEGLEYICTATGVDIPRGQVSIYVNNTSCFHFIMFKEPMAHFLECSLFG